jgi:AraC-like DNA-binding protein
MSILKSPSGQLTLMVTEDSHMKAIYTRSLSNRWYGQLVSSIEDAYHLMKVNQPYIVFIDQSLPQDQAERFIAKIQHGFPSTVMIFMAEKITGELALRLWGKVKELLPKPILETTIQKICEKYCLSQENSQAVWRVAAQMISQHYSDADLSEHKIARELGLTQAYFSRLFKARTGRSFRETLNETRMNAARQLLHDTVLQIKEIAYRVGYNRVDSFIKNFQKTTGESPSTYRQRNRITKSVSS